jgi:hypothetical protein
MSSMPPRRSIQELGLDDSEELKLYLELIRIIEKDIDEITAGATRNGWTSWAMLGGIVGAFLLLLGETRKLQTFPREQVEAVWLAGLLLYTIAISSLRVFYVDDQNIRPGRVRWSNDVYFSLVPSGAFTLLIFFFSIFLASTLPLSILAKVTSLAALTVWTAWMVLLLVMSRIEFPLGNTKITKKSGRWVSLVNLFLSLLALVCIGTQLRAPLGDDATLPYVLAGLILAITLLMIRLIFTMAPSRLLSNLKDLRNDIVFLRADIDEGLRRYEILCEGETLPDAHQKDLSEILRDINVIAYIHSNMNRLIQKMSAELPYPNDSEQTKEQKAKQITLLKDSYLLHEAKCREILSPFETRLKKLNKKLVRVGGATEDWAGANAIRSSLSQELELVERGETQLKQRRLAIDYYLSNPDKIPQELRAPTDPSADSANSGKEAQ